MARRHTIDVKAIRDAHGLTQQDLAREIGVDRKTIHRWETETRTPSPLARRQLARFMTPRDGTSAQRRPLRDSPDTTGTVERPRGVIPGL